MTRHLYDLEKLMNSEFCDLALNDKELYKAIVEHRKMITNVSWIDYGKHQYKYIDFIPPKKVIGDWKNDYKNMKESMFYGETLSFEKLIERLTKLKGQINEIE